jgi:hypothetical protein
MSLNICIPSYKRSDSVRVFQWIPKSYKDNVYLYVREDEYQDYFANYGDRCHVIPITGVSNIGETRRALCNHQLSLSGSKRIWQLDDDVTIHDTYFATWCKPVQKCPVIRPFSGTINETDFYSLIAQINTAMDNGYLHGAVTPFVGFPRFGYNYPTRVNSFAFTNTWLDLSAIPSNLVTYPKGNLACDNYIWLALITNGINSLTISNYLAKSSSPGTKGGCTDNRNTETWKACVEEVMRDFPSNAFYTVPRGSLGFSEVGQERVAIKMKVKRPDIKEVAARKLTTNWAQLNAAKGIHSKSDVKIRNKQ